MTFEIQNSVSLSIVESEIWSSYISDTMSKNRFKDLLLSSDSMTNQPGVRVMRKIN